MAITLRFLLHGGFSSIYLLLSNSAMISSHPQAGNTRKCLSQFCPAFDYRHIYLQFRNNLGARSGHIVSLGSTCRLSHLWDNQVWGGGDQHLVLQQKQSKEDHCPISLGWGRWLWLLYELQICLTLRDSLQMLQVWTGRKLESSDSGISTFPFFLSFFLS